MSRVAPGPARARDLFVPAALLAAGLAACSGTHKQPTGPAPEYEEAPPPSWLKDAGAAQPSGPAQALPIEPAPAAPAPASSPDGGSS